ncbi:CDC45-domain-containing protein [Aspergillus saccharolyticus JOP 1030-1]|uniref:CDC45-domain-containing protein n=1 Tax=Aspergillus saccharolyticus JOP 1030-1 TaxID=1450539 RepID=A0A318ZF13_9EURO|nr:CDC45-domain-containing protein [Aspergillus saccharolyticus JOP 1030-1]PYH45685.1 CDC45-domain-containing protein [Aspergillus saccharolyticus JOP 1030-1]
MLSQLSGLARALPFVLLLFTITVASEHTSNWAVLVSTSRFWFNYRHLANVLSLYRTVKRLGIPDSQIILMLPDDMACNPRNAFPGTVYSNADRAVDLYGDNIEVDYRGYEVTVENFIRLLTDRLDEDVPRSKRLGSDAGSNVLVYMTGHGGDQFLKFQDSEEIGAWDLADAFGQMWEKKRYHELLFMIDTCQANTMYTHFYSPNIIATGSSALDQSSYSHHADSDVGVAVIDRWTYYVLEFLETQVTSANSKQTLGDLFDSYDESKIHSQPGVRWDLFPGGEQEGRLRTVVDFFGNVQNVEVENVNATEPGSLKEDLIEIARLVNRWRTHDRDMFIQPVAGYGDLARAGEELVKPMRTTNGGSGGVVICLGVGGLVDLTEILCLSSPEDDNDNDNNDDGEGGGQQDMGGVEVWVFDARRPWNLSNVFGGEAVAAAAAAGAGGMADMTVGNGRRKPRGVDRGCITQGYTSGNGGIVVYDDGDIEEELGKEREAYCELMAMPEVEEEASDYDDLDADDLESDGEADPLSSSDSKKRKSWSRQDDEDESDENDGPPRQRRRSDSGSYIISSPSRPRRMGHDSSNSSRSVTPTSDSPSPLHPKQPSERTLRRRLLRMRRKYEGLLQQYYNSGTSYSEPISSLVYSLASELGREDNDLLWLAIVGVSSLELSGRTMSGVGVSNALEYGGSAGWGGERGERIRQILRDEVHRLNPPDPHERDIRGEINGVIPTTARSPTDKSIRLSPEPRFILIRHWSLYDSMLHSPYLASRLHVWTENGRKRLHKLLAKMGISLNQSHQNYTHMDMELKRVLRQRLLKYAPMYGLDGLVPPEASGHAASREGWGFVRCWGWKACLSATDVGVIIGAILEVGPEAPGAWDAKRLAKPALEADADGTTESDLSSLLPRFWSAYDALSLTSESPTLLLGSLPLAQHLHRAILRTGTSLLAKHQIRHLRAFRIAVVKEGPDLKLFTNPGALTKLALWVAEAIRVQERERADTVKIGRRRAVGTPLVLAGLDEDRGLYVVVGTGGGGGVVDFAALTKRREERRRKKEAKEKKAKEREQRRAKRAAERAAREDDEEDDDEETEESSSESESESEDEQELRGNKYLLRNRFGIAFQEVVQETSARVRIDSFEHCVVEVQKEDLGGFLEALSFRSVVG